MQIELSGKGLLILSLMSTGIVLADYTSEVSSSGAELTVEVDPGFEMIEGANGRCRKWNEGMLECWGGTDTISSSGDIISYAFPFKSGSKINNTSGSDVNTIHVVVSSKFRSGYGVSTGSGGAVSPNDNTYFTMERESGYSNQGTYYAVGYWK